MSIPYASIKTVFLDAGNTLISMDFAWIADELGRLNFVCDAAALRRAEAAARPEISAYAARNPDSDGFTSFCRYLAHIIARMGEARRLGSADIEALSRSVAARIKRPGQDYRLWSWVMPGVPEALAALRALGLELVVVSNSDGSVERALRELGLRAELAAVFDSELVGYEKPDPRLFAHALAELSAAPEHTVHVGDMYFQDVEGSRRAGLHSLLLDPYDDWGQADCERCRDLTELAARFAAARRVASRS